MAQTPISASVSVTSDAPVTLYTVPSGKTAIVKAVIPTVLTSSNTAGFTVNKNTNGSVIPLAINQSNSYIPATGGTTLYNHNLLSAPVTLAAGESISVSTNGSAVYKLPLTYSNSAYQIRNIVYANSQYMAVGYDSGTGKGLVLTSSNGTTWTKRTFTGATLTNVCYGNSLWVATSSTGGYIYTSADNGVTWTARTHTALSLYNVTYQNSLFVAVGANGYVITSSNGTTWTTYTIPDTSLTVYTAIYINSSWIIGTSGTTYKSTDNFSSFTSPYSANITSGLNAVGIVYNSYTGVWSMGINAVSVQGSTPTPIAYSSDLVTWTTTSSMDVYYSSVGVRANIMQSSYYTFLINNQDVSPNANYFASKLDVSGTTGWSNTYSLGGGTNIHSRAYNARTPLTQDWIVTSNGSSVYLSQQSMSGFSTSGSLPSTWSSRYDSTIFCGSKNTSGTQYMFALNVNNSNYLSHAWASGNAVNFNANTALDTTYYVYSYGTPQVCTGIYSSTTVGFLMGTDYGYLFRTTAYNSAMSLVASFTSGIVGIASNSTTQVVLLQDGRVATSTNNFDTYTLVTLSGGSASWRGAGYADNVNITCNSTTFAIKNVYGQVWKSTDGLTWTTYPKGVFNASFINSIPLLQSSYGLLTTADATTFTTYSTTNFVTGEEATNNIAYANSTYYIGTQNYLYSSTDLTTWTQTMLDSSKINNVSYFNGYLNTSFGLASNGTNLVLTGSQATQGGNGNISSISSTSQYLALGVCTGSIIEIS